MKQLDGEWWATVIHEFRTHVREESEFLAAYEGLVADSEDESVRFLLELIIGDERRHHDLFSSLADASVAADAVPAGPSRSGSSLSGPSLSAEQARRLLEPTARFLQAERDESRKLAALRAQLKPVRTDTLWPLLVELMEIDTAKHVRILSYLHDRLEAATR